MGFSSLFRSHVAHRILTIFVLCAVMPIGALATIAYFHVSRQLEEQSRTRVGVGSKVAGLAIFDRLLFVESELQMYAAELASLGRISPRTSPGDYSTPRLRGLVLARASGKITPVVGDLGELPPLSPAEREQLRSGGSVLKSVVSSAARIFMARMVAPETGEGDVLWAEINPVYLWRAGDDDVALASDAEICVFDAARAPLYCAVPDPHVILSALTPALAAGDAGGFQWEHGVPYVAGYWSLFLKYGFVEPKWTVVLSEPRAQVLAPLARFRQSFPLIALLGVLVVVFISKVEIQKSLDPLVELRDATQRLGSGDFESEVVIETGDEFQDLAWSFNRMTNRLKLQFEEQDRLNAALADTTTRLQENEARLRTILESAADAIVATDEHGVIETFNETAGRMFRYQSSMIIGQHVGVLFDPFARESYPRELWRITKDPVELEACRSNGEVFSAEFALRRAQLGGRTILVGFFRDLTARKRADEQRRALENQLVQAQKMETIGTLAGGIAHDFNNILTPIHAYVDLALADLPEDSETAQDLTHVKKAAIRAKDLVRQILTFSRAHTADRQRIDLEPIVVEAAKLLRAAIPTTINLSLHVDDECDAVVADATQIHQVIMNLGTNAYHAMRGRGGAIQIRLDMTTVDETLVARYPRLEAGRYVRLQVRDTGHGMDGHTMSRLFEPFFTTKDVGEGTGLGLSVVHGIVMSLGGEITVASTLGVGTNFTVYLRPAGPEAVYEARQEATAVEGHEHVLVVDDDPEIGQMAKRMLVRLGYDVTVKTSSSDALEIFRASPARFDVVFTDETMPQMSGTELARALREIRPDVPLILTTGFSPVSVADFVERTPRCSFVPKPYGVEVLTGRIRSVLHDDQSSPQEVPA